MSNALRRTSEGFGEKEVSQLLQKNVEGAPQGKPGERPHVGHTAEAPCYNMEEGLEVLMALLVPGLGEETIRNAIHETLRDDKLAQENAHIVKQTGSGDRQGIETNPRNVQMGSPASMTQYAVTASGYNSDTQARSPDNSSLRHTNSTPTNTHGESLLDLSRQSTDPIHEAARVTPLDAVHLLRNPDPYQAIRSADHKSDRLTAERSSLFGPASSGALRQVSYANSRLPDDRSQLSEYLSTQERNQEDSRTNQNFKTKSNSFRESPPTSCSQTISKGKFHERNTARTQIELHSSREKLLGGPHEEIQNNLGRESHHIVDRHIYISPDMYNRGSPEQFDRFPTSTPGLVNIGRENSLLYNMGPEQGTMQNRRENSGMQNMCRDQRVMQNMSRDQRVMQNMSRDQRVMQNMGRDQRFLQNMGEDQRAMQNMDRYSRDLQSFGGGNRVMNNLVPHSSCGQKLPFYDRAQQRNRGLAQNACSIEQPIRLRDNERNGMGGGTGGTSRRRKWKSEEAATCFACMSKIRNGKCLTCNPTEEPVEFELGK